MSQQMEALALANEARIASSMCLAEVRAGMLTVAEALEDPRAQCMPINRMLCAKRGWGPIKSGELLSRLHIWPTRQVRGLTARQKALIVEAIG